jgi:urease beta subunit
MILFVRQGVFAMSHPLTPGEYLLADDPNSILANKDRATIELTVTHAGDRPIQIGSHYHFFEVNAALQFDRAASYGMRLNIPAGTAVRFEPGETKNVTLVAFGGNRILYGHRGFVQGALDDDEVRASAMERANIVHKGDQE